MAGVNFVLGPKESYFFNCPRLWARHNLPPEIEMLFTKQPPIQDVFEMALGENWAYFVSYRDADGGVYCRLNNLPPLLTTFLSGPTPSSPPQTALPTISRDLPSLRLTLGPSNSFFAADESACQWSSLPPALEKALQSRLTETGTWKLGEQPAFVSLGAGGAYFMRTVGGGGAWELKGQAEGINTYLTNAPNFTDIKGLYLFPSAPEAYVLLTLAGTAFSNLPPHTWTDYNKISSALPRSQPPQTSQTPQIVQQHYLPQGTYVQPYAPLQPYAQQAQAVSGMQLMGVQGVQSMGVQGMGLQGIQSPPPQYVQPVATAPQLQTQTQSPLSPPPQYVQPATQPLQSPQSYVPPPQPQIQQQIQPQIQQPQSPQAYVPPPQPQPQLQPPVQQQEYVAPQPQPQAQPQFIQPAVQAQVRAVHTVQQQPVPAGENSAGDVIGRAVLGGVVKHMMGGHHHQHQGNNTAANNNNNGSNDFSNVLNNVNGNDGGGGGGGAGGGAWGGNPANNDSIGNVGGVSGYYGGWDGGFSAGGVDPSQTTQTTYVNVDVNVDVTVEYSGGGGDSGGCGGGNGGC